MCLDQKSNWSCIAVIIEFIKQWMHAIGHADYMLKSNPIIRLDYHDLIYIYTEIIVQYYIEVEVFYVTAYKLYNAKKLYESVIGGKKLYIIMLYIEYEHE